MILGIDEVGRGPWAGPLVVGAVVLGGEQIEGLTDSKKLSKKRREELAEEIYQRASGLGLGWVHAHEIDTIGLSEALVLATIRAVSQVNCAYSEIIIDGTINFLKETGKGKYVTTMKKADLLVPSVSAASIVAKVARDNYMDEQDAMYPGYGFASHVGYGTAKHRAAIEKQGVTPLHRLSFAPLVKYKDVEIASSRNSFAQGSTRAPASGRALAVDVLNNQQPTTKQIGDRAEDVVGEYLRKNGYEIIERNWKTKLCEIDIVASKEDTILFVEVKHRKSNAQGGGMAAITPKKYRQIEFAANLYTHLNQLYDHNVRLAIATTVGRQAVFESFLVLE